MKASKLKMSAKTKSQAFLKQSVGELAKEAIADVFSWLSKNEGKTVQDAVEALGLKMFTETELAPIINRVVAANKQQLINWERTLTACLWALL